MSSDISMQRFEQKMERALEQVRKVLHSDRHPQLASKVHHVYEDKYALTETMVNTAIASQLTCLFELGLSAEMLQQLSNWAQTKEVMLEFQTSEWCSFNRRSSREAEDHHKADPCEGHLGGMESTDREAKGKISQKVGFSDVVEVVEPDVSADVLPGPFRSVRGRIPTPYSSEYSHEAASVDAAYVSKVVTTVQEWFWDFTMEYKVVAYPSDREAEGLVVLHRHVGTHEIKTTWSHRPRPTSNSEKHNVCMRWLLRHIDVLMLKPRFAIDRAHKSCATPRRNDDIEAALQHFRALNCFCKQLHCYFHVMSRIGPTTKGIDYFSVLDVSSVFIPVLPFFEQRHYTGISPASDNTSSVVQSCSSCPSDLASVNSYLLYEKACLKEKCEDVRTHFGSNDSVCSSVEGILVTTLSHLSAVCEQLTEAVDYVEGMIRQQLVAAMAKEVTPADFAEYMEYHNQKLFLPEFAPRPFCYSVRRSTKHGPEGTVSIEEERSPGFMNQPIMTMVSHLDVAPIMRFLISASVNVTFSGDRYLHASCLPKFCGTENARLHLVSRARRFSSLLVLVGRIVSADIFEPQYAAIVQNEDSLSIPLELVEIPAPKEFKDTTQSLATEQRRFSQAFRTMQLQSTLFGVCVIQIKPLMEKVLGLPTDTLTKEIKLTQELMELLTKYQVPSDILSFDGDHASPTEAKLNRVKQQVETMQAMIQEVKDQELRDEQMQAMIANAKGNNSKGVRFSGNVDIAEPAVSAYAHSMRSVRGRIPTPIARDCISNHAITFSCSEAEAPVRSVRRRIATGFVKDEDCRLSGALERTVRSRIASPPKDALPPSSRDRGTRSAIVPLSVQPLQEQQHDQCYQHQQAPEQKRQQRDVETWTDFTEIPREMDKQFEALDTDGLLRATIINPGDVWTRQRKTLLSILQTSVLKGDEQMSEKRKAFDLLDGLTRSGALSVDHASLHVLTAATHCFGKTLLDTVVQDSINPIEKVDRSTLIMASTLQRKPAYQLLRTSQQQRLHEISPIRGQRWQNVMGHR